MGFFDRFKSKEEKKEKADIPDESQIDPEQLALKEIAVNSKDRNQRAIAADSITDQYVALDIAKNVKDRAIRLIAANKLKDESLLWDAAENSKFFDVRSFAYERLGENNKSISEIVKNTKKNRNVDEIFEKIVDEETLEDIAINAIDKNYRRLSLEKIESPEILYDLVFKANDTSIRKSAINKDKFVSEDILQKVAIEDKDEAVKIAAVKKIKNEETLQRLQ